MKMESKKLLTTKEVARLLRTTPSVVYFWVKQKKLKPYRVGKKLLFDWEEIERFLKGAENGKEQ